MLCGLAFVPPAEVPRLIDLVRDEVPDDLLPVADYFETTYVRCARARGRRREKPPRYEPELWNQYDAVLQRQARTNNLSEGWHNRFQVIVGCHHPSLYAALEELQKEQADTEIMAHQLQLGQRLEKVRSGRQEQLERHIYAIVSQYDEYEANDDVMSYLRAVGYDLHF